MTDSVLAAIEHVCDVIEHDFDVNVSDCVVAAVEHAVVVATAAKHLQLLHDSNCADAVCDSLQQSCISLWRG